MKARQQNTFRIVGGAHRGRRLEFPSEPSIRPSPDRVRETLFNWLAPVIGGARCLDLYAGSGALGLEALSRGAVRVEFVDRSAAAIRAIREHLGRLREAHHAAAHASDVAAFLRARSAQPFDIVFLDPPYGQGLLAATILQLEENRWLSPAARIYIESGRKEASPALPANWEVKREGTAGQVAYRLAVRHAASSSLLP